MQIRLIPLANAKGLPEEGELVKNDGTYLHVKVVKKGRGKAPATERMVFIPCAAVAYEAIEGTVVATDAPAAPAPARRGRKPKDEVVAENPAPKRRGRPPKVRTEETAEPSAPKKRGRPAKVKTEVAEENPAPKRRGRPPKINLEEAGAPIPKKRGRPAKAETPETLAPKKRGRPPKVKPVAEDVAPVAVDADDEGSKDQKRKKAAAEWNSSFKPEQVKPEKPAKPEKPKVQAARRPFSGDEYSLDD
jgi:hypothetical protein